MLIIRLFGQATFELNDEVQTDLFVTSKAKALMCYLVMQNRACNRDTLIGLLWGGSTMKNAQNSLRHVLSHLQKQFGRYLTVSRTSVRFERSQPYWLDVEQFEAPTPETHSLVAQEEQLKLYRGNFLGHLEVRNAIEFEDWVLVERERLNRIYVNQLQDIVQHCLQAQEYQIGLVYVDQLLMEEPWLEAAHEAKMRLLAYVGQRHGALQQYEQYQRALEQEFDHSPSLTLQTLYEQISSGTLIEQPEPEQTPLDEVWLTAFTDSDSLQANERQHHLQEMPQLDLFFGRLEEIAALQQMLVEAESRLVTIVGIGGQGKTTLAAQVCQMGMVTDHFEWMIWQQLINAPPLEAVVERLLQLFYQHQPSQIPDDLADQLDVLSGHLREARCLLIFDNAESILDLGQGGYQPGYEDYGHFIQQMGQTEHQSCLLITSRELPVEVSQLERDTTRVSTLKLSGVDADVGQQILQQQQVTISATDLANLVAQYSGNPLALKLIADTIESLFFGDVEAFLAEETLVYGQIQDVLDQQIGRLSEVEEAVLIWLAIERESVSMPTLWTNMYDLHTRQVLLEALRTLMSRSLLQRETDGFSLQNVVMEYLSDRLIDKICEEVSTGKVDWLQRFALLKAQSKDYVRQSQQRMFLRPIAGQLVKQESVKGVETQLQAILTALQGGQPEDRLGYGAANILHLLIHLGVDLRGYDFSNLPIWQAHLQDAVLPEVNVSGADLTSSVFMNALFQTMRIAYSPDGQHLATAHSRAEVNIWHLEDLTITQTFKCGNPEKFALAFSPDGRWLASNGEDSTIYVWDYQAGVTQHILAGHESDTPHLAFSPDSQLLASACLDGTVRLWDLVSGNMVATLEGHNAGAYVMAFTPDGEWLISTDADGRIFVWSVETKAQMQVVQGHEHIHWGIAVSPDGQWLATAGTDDVIKLWALPALDLQHTLTEHEALIVALAFHPDSRILASLSQDGTIRLWNVQTGSVIRILFTNTRDCYSLAFHPNGSQLVTCDETYPVRLWDVQTGEMIYNTKSSRQNEPYQLLFSPDDQWLVSTHINADIRLWDRLQTSPTPSRQRTEIKVATRYIALSEDGTTLVCTYGSNIQVWTFPGMHLQYTLAVPAQRLTRIALSPDAQQVAVATNDQLIRLGAIDKPQLDLVLGGHMSTIPYLTFSPDGLRLASSSYDGTIRLWDTTIGTCLHTLQTPSQFIYDVCFTPDGQSLISGYDQTICMWNVQTGEQIRQFVSHPAQVGWWRPLAINPVGTIAASIAQDGSILIWDIAQGQILRQLTGHKTHTVALAFSADGTTLASGANDETIRLWNTETGQLLSTLEVEVPYEGMNIRGVIGLASSTKAALKQLGAVDQP